MAVDGHPEDRAVACQRTAWTAHTGRVRTQRPAIWYRLRRTAAASRVSSRQGHNPTSHSGEPTRSLILRESLLARTWPVSTKEIQMLDRSTIDGLFPADLPETS